jgi:hypothetical protein
MDTTGNPLVDNFGAPDGRFEVPVATSKAGNKLTDEMLQSNAAAFTPTLGS